jgi:hypothetical protein
MSNNSKKSNFISNSSSKKSNKNYTKKIKNNFDFCERLRSEYKKKHKEVILLGNIIKKSKKKKERNNLNHQKLDLDYKQSQREIKYQKNQVKKLNKLTDNLAEIIKTLPKKYKNKFVHLYNFNNNSFFL